MEQIYTRSLQYGGGLFVLAASGHQHGVATSPCSCDHYLLAVGVSTMFATAPVHVPHSSKVQGVALQGLT